MASSALRKGEIARVISALSRDTTFYPDIEAPTCTQAQYCTVCSERIQAIAPHSYEETVIEADCHLDGGINYVCSACNTGYFEATQGALGHDPDKEAPTCTEDVICTRCDEVLEVAIGHTDV